MTEKSFQEHYPEETRHCYGCGELNKYGHQIKSFWEGDETICEFQPQPYHTSFPGFVYGGLIASLIDCHGTGTAAACAHRAEGREIGTPPHLRFVTGSLSVEYLKPTPIGVPLQLRGKARELRDRVAKIEVSLSANGILCATGKVIAVRVSSNWLESKNKVATQKNL